MGDCRTREEATVKIACIQMEPIVGEKKRNVQRSLGLIEEAAVNGAHLLVMPELCNSGYEIGRPAAVGRKRRKSTASWNLRCKCEGLFARVEHVVSPGSTSVTDRPFTMLQL